MNDLKGSSIVDLRQVEEFTIKFRPNEPVSDSSVYIYLKCFKSSDYVASGYEGQRLISEIFTKRLDLRKFSSEVPFT